MRLICVPLWLSHTLNTHGLTVKSLSNKDELSKVISKEDLYCYTSSYNELSNYLYDTYGDLDLYKSLCSPLLSDNLDDVDYRVRKNENIDFDSIENVLVGRSIPDGSFIVLKVKVLPVFDGFDDTIGIIVHLQEGNMEDKKKADADFLDQLLEVLYAHNRPLTDLARSGLIGAFINNLGQDV